MRIQDEKLTAEAAYWGHMEEWTEQIPETPLWVDMRKADYMPYPRCYLPTMASSYDPFTYKRLFGKVYENIFAFLENAGEHVFEIGCGSGFLSLEMARMGKNVFAFDLSEQRIRLAKRYYESLLKTEAIPGSINYFVGNATNIMLMGNQFDAVLCHGSLHHLAELEKVLNNIYRSLKPGGLFIIFEHRGLDARIEGWFLKMDKYIRYILSRKQAWNHTERILRRDKKLIKHPALEESRSPMEGVSSHDIEMALGNCQMKCIIKNLYSPFAFHFIERYATVFDWRIPFKVPALLLLNSIDCFLEKAGFKGELIFWAGEKR